MFTLPRILISIAALVIVLAVAYPLINQKPTPFRLKPGCSLMGNLVACPV
jgi:hypothetical protein